MSNTIRHTVYDEEPDCDECEHLLEVNSPIIYAVCLKSNYIFNPFETDTRIHYCAFGEKKETTLEQFKKRAETIQYDELRIKLAENAIKGLRKEKNYEFS